MDADAKSLVTSTSTGLSIPTTGQCTWFNYIPCDPFFVDQCLYTAGGGAYQELLKCYIETVSRKWVIRNGFPHDVELTFWKCYPRHDLPVVDGRQVAGELPGIIVNGVGEVPIAPGTGDPVTAVDYGTTPYMSPPFCRAFKIKQWCSRMLKPGGQITVLTNIPRSRVVSLAYFGCTGEDVVSDKYEILKMFGPIICMRVQGSVVHDESKTNEGKEPSTVHSSSRASLDMLFYDRMSIRVPYPAPQRALGRFAGTGLREDITLNNEAQYNQSLQENGGAY